MIDECPLCCDLDGSLIKEDLFFLAVKKLLSTAPYQVFFLVTTLFSGKAAIKSKIHQLIDIDLEKLNYNQELISFLRIEKDKGRTLILVTGADQSIANDIADRLKLFNHIMASDGSINLTCEQKAQALVNRFGVSCFDYIGNSFDDLPVWQVSRKAFLVEGCGTKLLGRLMQIRPPEKIFSHA